MDPLPAACHARPKGFTVFGPADDAMAFCLAAAGLVVVAHVTDALSGRRHPHGEGWGRSLALALAVLAVIGLVAAAVLASSTTDLLLILATCTAVTISTIPLLGPRDPATSPRQNPWDRAYRVRPARVAELLAPPRRRRAERAATDRTPREGVVVTSTATPSPVAEDRLGPARTDPGLRDAEETLQDVTDIVGDLDRLLGLDRDRRE